jgi:hypothetical protein
MYGGYTGDSVPGAMRDGVFNTSASVIGTGGGWISADLGSVQPVGRIEVAPIPASFDAWGAYYLNSNVEYSTNGATWTVVGPVPGPAEGTYSTVSLGGVSARYVRLHAGSWLGAGDFKVFAP